MKTPAQLRHEHTTMLTTLRTLETSYVSPMDEGKGCAYCSSWNGKHDDNCIIAKALNSITDETL